MKKMDTISKIVSCAIAYRDNLVNRNFLFVIGMENTIEYFETIFLPRHFMHLTGIVCTDAELKSVDFYNMCITGKLPFSAIELNKDGTTRMKLLVLSQLMCIHKTARMAGDFRGASVKLQTSKVAGTTVACMGFVQESEYSNLYVPNTVLNIDTRKAAQRPIKRVMTVFEKEKDASSYSLCTYTAKGLALDDILKNHELAAKIST